MTQPLAPLDLARLYEDAAAYIRKYGWWKMGFPVKAHPVKPEACTMNAIWFTVIQLDPPNPTAVYAQAHDRLKAHLGLSDNTFPNSCIQWNDAPERTVEDVLTLLSTMASALRLGH